MSDMKPYAFHVADYIEEEMAARGWNVATLADRMGWSTEEEYGINHLTVEMMLAVRDDPKIVVDKKTAKQLGKAFGVSPELFLNLDHAWHEAMRAAGGSHAA